MKTTDETIIICAVRYALGRMSYMVGEVCRYVTFKRKALSMECLEIIIRDIEEELGRYHNAGQMLGMECDEKQWTRLLELLKTEKENKWQESMKNSLY